jgi:hypothetical protein
MGLKSTDFMVTTKVDRLLLYCGMSREHYSQVKLKTLLSMSNLTHFLPVDPIKIGSSLLTMLN